MVNQKRRAFCRVLSMVLCLAMVLPYVPALSFAAEGASAAVHNAVPELALDQKLSPASTTAEEAVVVDSDGTFYQLATQLLPGNKYVFADRKGIGTATILTYSTQTGQPGLGYSATSILQYNDRAPYLLVNDSLSQDIQNMLTWTVSDSGKEGYVKISSSYTGTGTSLEIPSNDGGRYINALRLGNGTGMLSNESNLWGYDQNQGLYSYVMGGSDENPEMARKNYLFTFGDADSAHAEYHNKWWLVNSYYLDGLVFNRVYAYEERELIATAELSDMDGKVALNAAADAQTGTMIIKAWADGQIEYIPVTVSMLRGSFDVNTAGVYKDLSVVYNDVTVDTGYTLVVGNAKPANSATISVSEDYYYRVTNQFREGATFNEEARYLILNRNTIGAGKMMVMKSYSTNSARTADVIVTVDADGVPAVKASNMPAGTLVFQEWWYHKHDDGQWYLWQPNWNGEPNNYLRMASITKGKIVGGNVSEGNVLVAPQVHKSQGISNYTTVQGSCGSTAGHAMYIEFNPNSEDSDHNPGCFIGVNEANRTRGQEVYIYEKVTYNTATCTAVSTHGHVTAGSAGNAATDTKLLITYPDGRKEYVDVTLNMLSGSGLNTGAAGEYSNLTLTYNGTVITSSYELHVTEPAGEQYPDAPNAGHVNVDKQKDTSEFNFDETGVARVDLSTYGIPMASKLDVLVVVDTSSSVTSYMDDGQTRIEAMRAALNELVVTLRQPNSNGSMPDIQLSVLEFNDYTYFTNPNTLLGNDNNGTPHSVSSAHPDVASNGVVLDYQDIYDVPEFTAEYLTPRVGTNYDVAMQMAYETVSARKAGAGADREQVVIFMTDGICYQYNYLSYSETADQSDAWAKWLTGGMSDGDLQQYVPADAQAWYNPEGKHWMAEAIKGSPSVSYPVIWNESRKVAADASGPVYSSANWTTKPGLGATVFTVGFGINIDGETSARVGEKILSGVASDPSKYYNANNPEELRDVFRDAVINVQRAATNAYFVDQMGASFQLQMSTVTNSKGETVAQKPTITVKVYDIYKQSEVGTVVNGTYVTEQMVGTRKSNTPAKILETVTFSADGKQAYSDRIYTTDESGRKIYPDILINGVINAYYFQYNTNSLEYYENLDFTDAEINALMPQPETFLWKIGEITEQELVLSYYVYLENAMGEDGVGVSEGTYDTNNFANLEYTNYQNQDCIQTIESPELNWKDTQIKYGYYLVDSEGNPIDPDGNPVDFSHRYIIGSVSTHADRNLNVDNAVTPGYIPAGYTLYEVSPNGKVNVNSGSNCGGEVYPGGGTTYITLGDGAYNSDHAGKNGDYHDATVWFALVKKEQTPGMVVNKTVEATADPNSFILTLDAYTKSRVANITKPADIVLVLDHSGSMRTPAGAPDILYSPTNDWAGELYGGPGRLTKYKLDPTKGQHTGYYVAQSTTSKWWFVMRYDATESKWYAYSVPSTQSIVDPRYKNAEESLSNGSYSEHTMTQAWSYENLPEQLVYYKTQYGMLYDETLSFVEQLRKSGVEHRVAIIGFAGSETQGSRVYVGGSEDMVKSYHALTRLATEERADYLYRLALKNVQDETEYGELMACIEAIETNHSFTCPSAGIDLATRLFKANEVNLAGRDRIMILFTDGIPNRQIGDPDGIDVAADKQNAIFNEIVQYAYTAKHNYGVQIYSISTTTLGSGADRRFLSYASSDYPNATSYTTPGTAISGAPKYTSEVENAADMDNIFGQIQQETVNSLITLDENAVLREVLSDYVQLDKNANVKVKVYTQPYLGNDNWGELVEFTAADGMVLRQSPETGRVNVIEVSGFDYHAEYVSETPRAKTEGGAETYRGSKLVVKVYIETRDGFWGGNNVPTNNTAENVTGIYTGDTMVEVFPEPEINVPISVDVVAEDKTIYYGNDVKPGDLIDKITVGGEKVTVGDDGTLTPEQDWMDDFADIEWNADSTKPTDNVSSTEPEDYTFGVTVSPKYDGSHNQSDNPSNIDGNINGGETGDALSETTKTDSDTGHVYILVPTVTFKDSVIDFAVTPDGNYYPANNYVDATWSNMETNLPEGTKVPAVSGEAPELTLGYEAMGQDKSFAFDTPVNVTVSSGNGADISGVTTFDWEQCQHSEQHTQGNIEPHKANDANEPEFYIHVELQAENDAVVIDFGLPVDIHVLNNDYSTDTMKPSLAGIAKTEGETLTDNAVSGGFGVLSVLKDEATLRYTLNTNNGMQMSTAEVFYYGASYVKNGTTRTVRGTVTVIPAANIYYEDSFLTFENSGAATEESPMGKWSIVNDGDTTITTRPADPTQDEDRPGADVNNALGNLDADNVYGYDSAYDECTKYSLGVASTVTVNAATGAANVAPTATFTFTGTGFDVVGLTDSESGGIWVQVKHVETIEEDGVNKQVEVIDKSYIVNTYYGYDYKLCKVVYTKLDGKWKLTHVEEAPTGADKQIAVKPDDAANGTKVEGIEYAWIINPDASDSLYQVPVIKVDDLDYGTYNVTIKAVYLASMDMDLEDDDFVEVNGQKVSTGSYTVWLDAIRVYNPAQGNDTAENAYQQDGESNPHFVTVKDLLVGPGSFNAGDANIGAVYVDGKSTDVTIDEYNNQGPNNETYLKNGNAIAFKLRYLGTKAPSINLQIGAKLAKGTSVTLNWNGHPLAELATATNMFYKLEYVENDETVTVQWDEKTAEDGTVYYESEAIVLSCSADASSILSLTDLKITGSDAAAIEEMPATSTAATLSLVCDEDVVETARKYLASSASESEQFEINLAQAELGNALNLYFLFPADSYADWTGCYAVVTKTYADGRDDVTVTVPASEWDEKISGGKTLKRVGFHAIAAKEMGDAISITVYNANGEAISTPYSDSIVKYLTRMLEKNTDPEFRRLAVDMLVYGSAAQLQFHYNEENLAYDGLTNEQMLYGSVMLDPIFTDVRVKTETVRGTSVSLENNIVMNVFFVDQTADMTATVTFVNHNGDTIDEKLTSTESKNGYCFVVDQLAVADARSVLVTVTCYDADGNVYGSVTDSVESYFARNSTSSGLDSAIVLLADSAYEYLH